EIVEAYKSTGSDLLLMGAYSRNRMSQLVFGGVTEYMLKRASIPVLMLHS
ncbi:MAG: universal stress protein, partial [Gammaproteobacteria bacterium]